MAAGVPLSFRIAANLGEFRKNLEEAQTTLETTKQAVQRMTQAFGSNKLIADANAVVKAIGGIEGVSKLTEAQQARVNRIVTEGIAQYQALGRTAPAEMLKIADATKQVEQPADGLSLKMTALGSFIGNMAADAVAALGRLALQGLKFVADGIADLVTRGGQVSAIATGFTSLAGGVAAADRMLVQMRTGTAGLVKDFDLMQAGNKSMLLGLGLSATQMGELATIATRLGRAMGQDATKSLDDMIVALGRVSPMILDNLGLSVKVADANERYAAMLGKTAEDLTDAEKKQAFMNAALDAGRAKVAAMGDLHLTFSERLQQASAAAGSLYDRIAQQIAQSSVLAAGFDSISKAIAGAFGGNNEALVRNVVRAVEFLATRVADAGLIVVEFARTGVQAFGSWIAPTQTVRAAITTLISEFANGVAVMAELAAKMPGVGMVFDETAAAARRTADGWAASRRESELAMVDALAMAAGQGKVHGVLDGVAGALINMKAAMTAASLETNRATETTNAHARATTEQSARVDAAAASLARFHTEIAKFDEKAKVLPPFTGLLGNMERKVVELDTSTQALRTNLRFTSQTIADEMAPAVEQVTAKMETARQVAVSWSDAMALVAKGQGTMTASAPQTQLPFDLDTPEGLAWLLSQPWYAQDALRDIHRKRKEQGVDTRTGQPVPGRAMGGPVTAGQPYIVGEKRPELFIPTDSGVILPSVPAASAAPAAVRAASAQPAAEIHIHNHFHAPIMGAGNKAEFGRLVGEAAVAYWKSIGLPVRGVA